MVARPFRDDRAPRSDLMPPGFWLGLDGLYYTGGQMTIDRRKGESNENARIGLTLTIPANIRACASAVTLFECFGRLQIGLAGDGLRLIAARILNAVMILLYQLQPL